MNALDLDGLDLEGLAHEADKIEFPPMVKGRTVHIDADFLAYQVSAEKEDDPKTYEDMQHNAEVAVETLRGLAAAEYVHMHLTPSTSNKGGRYDLALQRPYQGNREDKPKPRMLNIMRQWLADRYPGTLHQFCEADDGMAAAQYAAIRDGRYDLSIIASKDKDLSMVPGWHLEWDTGNIIEAEDFGRVWIVEKKSALGQITKKLKGYGRKWFWAQMLIGDTADHIQGLPKVPGAVMNRIQPTLPITAAFKTLQDEKATDKQREKATKILNERKPMACGPATAIKLLDMMGDHKQAFAAVKGLYEMYGAEVGFVNYRDGSPVAWQQAFLSEAQLLWMRRDALNPNCVVNYWQEIHA
ncbi:putative 5'-3' exonuclease protein [Rhizobium phage RHph_X3_9]|nr:putative 5'-3' exonuclease protein [Rhizobium phage RHph_X3_9]